MRRFACLEAAREFFLRKLGCQGVKSTSSTREACPLTPHLARPNSNTAFAKAEPAAKAVQSGRSFSGWRSGWCIPCETHPTLNTPLLPLQSPLTTQDFRSKLINPRPTGGRVLGGVERDGVAALSARGQIVEGLCQVWIGIEGLDQLIG